MTDNIPVLQPKSREDGQKLLENSVALKKCLMFTKK
jgi:hypothetical protein